MTKPILPQLPPQRGPGAPIFASQKESALPGQSLHNSQDTGWAIDLRAARTDRLTALCLLLALCAPAALGLSSGAARASLLPPPGGTTKPKASAPASKPRATGNNREKIARATPRAGVTLADVTPDWRSDLLFMEPQARANDGTGNPLPGRAMFPISLLARVPGGLVSGIVRDTPRDAALAAPGVVPGTGLAPLPVNTLLTNNSLGKPGARSDAAINSLPFVWKGGMASLPLLADAREEIKAAPPALAPGQALPPLPQKADGTPDFSRMGKVVNATALKLPPASRPLPPSLQAVAVPADTKYISSLPRLAQATAPGTATPPAPGAANQINVTVSTFVVLVAPDDLQTVAIADPSIADVVVVNSRAVLINGKAPGATSLVIVDKRIRQYHVQVVPAAGSRPEELASSVAAAINLPEAQVKVVNNAVVLEGQVASADEQKRAGEIAGLFSPKVVNLLQIRSTAPVEGPAAPLDTQIKNAIRTEGVEVRVLGNTVLLEGRVNTDAQRATAEAVATALAKDMKVVNLLSLPVITAPVPTRLTIDQINDTLRPQQLPEAPVVPGVVLPPHPVTRIIARQVADQVILEGTATSAEDIAQANTLAARTGLSVVNRIALLKAADAMPADLQTLNALATSISRAVPGSTITVSGSKERLVLAGTAPTTNAAVLAEQIARSYSTKVDNLMTTPRPQQIDVDITVLEINKTDLKNLGVTFTSLLDSTATNPTGFVIGQGPPGIVAATPANRAFQFQSPFQAAIRAEVSRGNARLLSNPRTTVLSGRTATFKVGGEVPIPGVTTLSGSGNATTSIIFKPFGILLDVTPVVSDDGVVTAQIRTEVSQPDFTIGVVPPGGGGIIPGFSQRQAQTEVTIEPGGTLALGGLIQNNITNTRRELPLLSRIPILGALFSSKRFQKNETELVIFVTPRLLENKLKPGQLAPARPVSVGESESVPVQMGVPSIPSFVNNSGGFAISAGGAGGGGGGGGQ